MTAEEEQSAHQPAELQGAFFTLEGDGLCRRLSRHDDNVINGSHAPSEEDMPYSFAALLSL